MAMKVQTVIFSRSESPSDVNDGKGWTVAAAKSWLKEHDLDAPKVDETEDSYRFRQFEPSKCRDGSFVTMTKDMPSGVSMVACETTEDGVCVLTVHEPDADQASVRALAGASGDKQPGDSPLPVAAGAPAVHVPRSFAADWHASGRDARHLQLVGRELADRLGRPALAEQPIVRPRTVSQALAPADDSGRMLLDCPSCSTGEWNRNDEQVVQDGWELEPYKAYPVLILGHDYYSPIINSVVGKALVDSLKTRPNLRATFELMNDEDGKGRKLYALARFLGAVTISPGFQPLEWELVSEKADEGQYPRQKIRFLRQELLELSVPTIPANSQALAFAATNGLIDDKIRPLVVESNDVPPPPALSVAGLDGATLESILRDLTTANLSADLYGVRRGLA